MRLRFGVLVLVLVAALTGCGGDDDKSNAASDTTAASTPTASADSGDGDVKCAEFLAGKAKAEELVGQLQSGADLGDAIDDAAKQFDALKANAPDEIQDALDEVKAAFLILAEFYKNPQSADQEKLADAGKRLGDNALILNTYVTENCAGQ